MKFSNLKTIYKLLFLLTFSQLLNITKSITNSSEEELKKELQEISNTKRKSKLLACMSLIRNSLAEDNKDLRKALKNSKFDRSESFDKIIFRILYNCQNKIIDSEIEILLNPDNIISSLTLDDKFMNLIKFEENVLENIELTQDELLIQNEIQETSEVTENEVLLIEEEFPIFGFKFSLIGRGLYIFIVIAVAMSIIIVCGGLYMLLCKKTVVNDKRKKNN